MGGNVFGTLPRLTRDEYTQVCQKIVRALNISNFKVQCDYYIPKVTECKESFGDIDIYICPKYEHRHENLNICFLAQHYINKDDIIVVDFKMSDGLKSLLIQTYIQDGERNKTICVQVDINYYKPDEDCENLYKQDVLNYFKWHDYGDFSNLIGRILSNNGFKYRPWRLYLRHYVNMYDNGVIVSEYMHSDKAKEIGRFEIDFPVKLSSLSRLILGVDIYTDESNYTEKELFGLLVQSPLFKKEYYDLDNRDAKSRARDKKRPMYMRFLEYIKDIDDNDDVLKIDKNILSTLCPTIKIYGTSTDVKSHHAYVLEERSAIQKKITANYFLGSMATHSRLVELVTGLDASSIDNDVFIKSKPLYQSIRHYIGNTNYIDAYFNLKLTQEAVDELMIYYLVRLFGYKVNIDKIFGYGSKEKAFELYDKIVIDSTIRSSGIRLI